MRKLSLLTAAILITSFGAAHAQVKLGTVDMNKVFVEYYKTKDAEAKLNEARAQAKKEFDERMERLKKSMDEITKLNEDIEKPELSKEKRAALEKERDQKVGETRSLDQDTAEFRQTRERQLQDQFMRMRKDIIEDIMKVVNDKVKAEGYDLVLDKSGISLGQVNVVLYARNDLDFSAEVIAALNKSAPKTGSTTAP